jgi:hypothetical protein
MGFVSSSVSALLYLLLYDLANPTVNNENITT